MTDPFSQTIIETAYAVNGTAMDLDAGRELDQVLSRTMAAARLSEFYGWTPAVLARNLGYTSRTSAYDLLKRHGDMMDTDPSYARRYRRLITLTPEPRPA